MRCGRDRRLGVNAEAADGRGPEPAPLLHPGGIQSPPRFPSCFVSTMTPAKPVVILLPSPQPAAAGPAAPTSACPGARDCSIWPAPILRLRLGYGRNSPEQPRCRRLIPARSRQWPMTSSGGSGRSPRTSSSPAPCPASGQTSALRTSASATRTPTLGRSISNFSMC